MILHVFTECVEFKKSSSLPLVVCRRVHVLFTLFVFVRFVFTSSCLQEGACLIYVICVCLVRLYLQLFVGGSMSYLRYLCLFGSSLPTVVCRREHVFFTLFVFVRLCLQLFVGELSMLFVFVCLCLQLFVGDKDKQTQITQITLLQTTGDKDKQTQITQISLLKHKV